MDLRLPLLADAQSHLNVAAEAIEERSMITAAHELERADAALQELRELWPEIKEQERGLLAQMAAPLSKRLAELQKQIPVQHAIAQGQPIEDPEQDLDPEES